MKKKTKRKYGAIINKNIPKYSKEPYFVKKHAEAKESYLRCPLPPELIEKILKETK